MKIFYSVLFILYLTKILKAYDEDDSRTYNYIYEYFNQETKTKHKKLEICKALRNSENNLCDEKTWQNIQQSWEIGKGSISFYLQKISETIGNHSKWTHEISYKWAKIFDERTEKILSSSSSSFICQLAADKWKRFKRETPSNTFFGQDWLPKARKCTSFLEMARRSSLCMICDKKNYDSGSINYQIAVMDPRKGYRVNEFQIALSDKDCSLFVKNCIDYINIKEIIVKKFNLELTLSMCDYNGKFIAWGKKEEWHKILPSQTMVDKKDREKCSEFNINFHNFLNSGEHKDYAGEKACKKICMNYFSLNMMIYDDISQFDNFKYTERILSEVVKGNYTQNLFIDKEPKTKSFSFESMENVIFYFRNNDEPEFGDIDKAPQIELLDYLSDSGLRAFPVAKFVKKSFMVRVLGIVVGVFSWLYWIIR